MIYDCKIVLCRPIGAYVQSQFYFILYNIAYLKYLFYFEALFSKGFSVNIATPLKLLTFYTDLIFSLETS